MATRRWVLLFAGVLACCGWGLVVAGMLVGCATAARDADELDDDAMEGEAEEPSCDEVCSGACLETAGSTAGACVDGICVCDGPEDSPPLHDPVPGQGCDLDILFVVDSSGSMMDAAASLAEVAFPSFADELEQYPDLGSYRVAVKNHLYGENEVTDGSFVQDSLFLTSGWPQGQPHDAFDCEEMPSVDCEFASGASWMVGPGETLRDEFRCVGSLACHQNLYTGEQTLQGGLEGLRFPENQGFLREEALLVVVYITDEDDQSGLAPQDIRQALLQIKGGDERYVVVLTLGGPEVGSVEVNPITHAVGCVSDRYGAIEQTPRLKSFSGLFGTRGLHYDLCRDDISSALTNAIDALEMSCQDIIF